MRIQLKIWRQESQGKEGRLRDYNLQNVTPDMSFLEMLDMLNDQVALAVLLPILLALSLPHSRPSHVIAEDPQSVAPYVSEHGR